ncbi:MAG: hypothetical protein JO136_15090 [Hyphomicrobiales bacterium]|nr:hypothetical protein [Hyphomicrobiales bacterium]MBV9909653.1 hypothetical protein [Hyphomicrobiales bacterium]
MGTNQGVVITGGAQSIGQVVAGTGARAEMHFGSEQQTQREELSRQIETLVRLLEERQIGIKDGAFLVGSARRIATEVAKPEPDKSKLSSLLEMLAEGTKDLTSIASVVGSAKALATTLFALV